MILLVFYSFTFYHRYNVVKIEKVYLRKEHKDMVSKDHIVGNAVENPGNKSPRSKESHGVEPELKASLLFQPKR